MHACMLLLLHQQQSRASEYDPPQPPFLALLAA
jgi:hypothetical protein